MPVENEEKMLMESGKILDDIGSSIYDQLDGNVEGALFFSEVGDMIGSGWILEDAGDRMIFHLPENGIISMAIKLSELLVPEKRWQILRYSVREGKFSAEFDYPKDIDQTESEEDRSTRIQKAWAGNRLIDNTKAIEEFNRLVAGADLYPDG